MAVVPMKKMLICGLKKDRKKTLEFLQRQEIVELSDDIKHDAVFQTADFLSRKAVFERNAALAEQALEVLAHYAPEEKGLFSALEGRQLLSVEVYEEKAAQHRRIMETASRIIGLTKAIDEKEQLLVQKKRQMEELLPWRRFDVPLDFSGTKSTKLFVGSVQKRISEEELLAVFGPLLDGAVCGQILSASDEQSCFWILCRKRDAKQAEGALQGLGYIRAPRVAGNPAAQEKQLKQEILEVRKEIQKTKAEIRELASCREELKFVADYYRMRAEKYEVLNGLSQSRSVFLITGYLPADRVDALKAGLESCSDIFIEFSEPGESEDIPVLLHNNGFSEPVEGVVESYSLPGRGETDPTAVTASFYYILFGLMLADAAYGLIMVAGCLFCLKKFPRMEDGMKRMLKLFLGCGISTTFWGLMFGSFFGDAVSVIAATFFHRPDISFPVLWFEPVSLPMKMLAFSFALGIIHLFAGLGMKLYGSVRSGHPEDGIYDVVFWYMLVGGLIVYMLSMSMFTEMLGLGFTLPLRAGQIAAGIAVAGLVGIILTGGRESKNWGKRILKGLYSAYGVTSYLSDILSYSRLLALGLATSVISTVFNQMGSMAGDGPAGVILFIIVFVIGHSLNLAINVLGAYVHTNRLQFVEFFGKFYEGGGRKFRPFAIHTKYYKVKEDA